MIGDNHSRLAARVDQRRQFTRHTSSRGGCVGDFRQTFPGNIIDDVQDTEPPAARKLIMHKINSPARIRATVRGRDRCNLSGTVVDAAPSVERCYRC